jgi:hypothetical protein
MKCPTCKKHVEWADNPSRPFCSERCKLLDFDRWVSEDYRVAGAPLPAADLENEAVGDEGVGD